MSESKRGLSEEVIKAEIEKKKVIIKTIEESIPKYFNILVQIYENYVDLLEKKGSLKEVSKKQPYQGIEALYKRYEKARDKTQLTSIKKELTFAIWDWARNIGAVDIARQIDSSSPEYRNFIKARDKIENLNEARDKARLELRELLQKKLDFLQNQIKDKEDSIRLKQNNIDRLQRKIGFYGSVGAVQKMDITIQNLQELRNSILNEIGNLQDLKESARQEATEVRKIRRRG